MVVWSILGTSHERHRFSRDGMTFGETSRGVVRHTGVGQSAIGSAGGIATGFHSRPLMEWRTTGRDSDRVLGRDESAEMAWMDDG